MIARMAWSVDVQPDRSKLGSLRQIACETTYPPGIQPESEDELRMVSARTLPISYLRGCVPPNVCLD